MTGLDRKGYLARAELTRKSLGTASRQRCLVSLAKPIPFFRTPRRRGPPTFETMHQANSSEDWPQGTTQGKPS
jgi:hypothetical protein